MAIYKGYASYLYNSIGIPGQIGFGVGICPEQNLPPGMVPMVGCYTVGHPNYGNYVFAEGSQLIYVPKNYILVGNGSNGLSVNLLDVADISRFPTTAIANAAGYMLHRAFIDGGQEQQGYFVDKYLCSQNSWGSGYIASSLPKGNPISASSAHNPIGNLTAANGTNAFYAAIDCAKARDGINGLVNPNSNFFCCSQFIRSNLAILSMAHGQASASTSACGWFGSSHNFPKGCNNNTLGDTDDSSVLYLTDGYSNCGKTGSGIQFSKTTHNGQPSGIADLNGLLCEISTGLTSIGKTVSITAATQANPCVITAPNHGFTTGQIIMFSSVGGMTQLLNNLYTITVIDTNTFSLNGVNSTGYTAFTSGGTANTATFYAANQSTAMKAFTSGNTLATDHWGSNGVAATMSPFAPPFVAGAGGSSLHQYYGNGANQVLAPDMSGANWLLTGLGMPATSNGLSVTGTDLFGTNLFYQYMADQLCLISSGDWGSGVHGGEWNLNWAYARAYSGDDVGFRVACYPV
jgi:hypothetical protein